MHDADVIHLALHCVVGYGSQESKLLLAQEPDTGMPRSNSPGVLEANEIRDLQMPRARLVVLSACRSGVEGFYGGEGLIGMSRNFIASRVPLVIGSLWNADDMATKELMVEFHQRRRTSEKPKANTVEALRLAQMKMIKDPAYSHPYYWAAFVTIGGHAEF